MCVVDVDPKALTSKFKAFLRSLPDGQKTFARVKGLDLAPQDAIRLILLDITSDLRRTHSDLFQLVGYEEICNEIMGLDERDFA